jgi:5'-nucleotidase
MNDVKGVQITVQGRRDVSEAVIDARVDARGIDYYWLGFKRQTSTPAIGTDLYALREGYISVTPLHLDLTHHESRESLRRCFEGFDTTHSPPGEGGPHAEQGSARRR